MVIYNSIPSAHVKEVIAKFLLREIKHKTAAGRFNDFYLKRPYNKGSAKLGPPILANAMA